MGEYLRLLARPSAWRLILSSLPGRIAYGISGLAIFFHVSAATHSITAAGFAAGAYGGSSAATAAIRGKIIDLYGQTRPLLLLVPSYAVACTLLGFYGHNQLTAVAFAALMGVTAPPINMSVRPLWKEVAGEELVRTAYALDTVVVNSTSLVGPAVATWLALSFSGAVALYSAAILMLVGGTLLASASVSRNWISEPREPGAKGVFRSPAMRVLAFEGTLIGLGFGMFDIAIPSAAKIAGVPQWAALSLAALSLGGIVGGAIAGAQFKHWAPATGVIRVQALFALLITPLFLLPVGWPTALVLLIAGLPAGMGQVFYFEVIDLVRPRGMAVGSLGAIWFIEGPAGAAGNSLGGILVDNFGTALPLALTGLLTIGSVITLAVASKGALKPAMKLTGADPEVENL